jgi:N-acetylneuraminic acid mutarotase
MWHLVQVNLRGLVCLLSLLLMLLVFSPSAGAGNWATNSSMNFVRQNLTLTVMTNGNVLAVGGGIFSGSTTATEIYDSTSATWKATNSLNNARQAHTATLLPNGKILAVGGYDGGLSLNSAELYDPTSDVWNLAGTVGTSRRYHSATLLTNGLVLVAGGYSGNAITSCRLYNPVSNLWSATGPLNTARYAHTASLLTNGLVLVTGGLGTNVSYSATAELYDPATGVWTITSSMQAARAAHTATKLPDGNILVVGGASYAGSTPVVTKSSEIYEVASGTWIPAGQLSVARGYHTATLLRSGKVLVVGGDIYPNGGPYGSSLASTELYNPSSGTWTNAANLATARHSHQAVLLANGSVLVAGGYGYNYAIPNSELYAEVDPFVLSDFQQLPNGAFRFGFTNSPGLAFDVMGATNPGIVLSNWISLGTASEILPGQFEFTDTQATNYPARFYRVRSN